MKRNWIKYSFIKENTSSYLVCLPYAGASASEFVKWRPYISGEFGLLPVQLPGREDTFGQDYPLDISANVKEIASSIVNHLDKPFLLYGHSMGALLAYELYHELSERWNMHASGVILSCCVAPDAIEEWAHTLYNNDKSDISNIYKRFGGTDNTLLEMDEFIEYYYEILRNDLQMVKNYRFKGKKKIQCPVYLLYGDEDETVKSGKFFLWRDYAENSCTEYMFPGGHFYMNTCIDKYLECIKDIINGEANSI